ncbi:MAG TPA: MgtC/SapB family protein [Blastocatellia bacterium]
MDQLSPLFQVLGIALGLGLLVGLQRESAASALAGVRTFPLVTILGTLCAWLSQGFGGWILAAGFLGLAAPIFIGKRGEQEHQRADLGLTTEVAMLLMFAVGAYLVTGYSEVAIAIGGGVAVLLHFKGQLHGLVERLGENDLKAIMQFALISLVILPVLPNRTYLPYGVINPRNIWWMVVLIVGISLGGYIVYRFFGKDAGIVMGGILGGLISSTATTVSYSKRTKNFPESVNLAAIVLMIASAVVFARLMIEIATVAPGFLKTAVWPLMIMLVWLIFLSMLLWFLNRHGQNGMPEMGNPTELKSALLFGLIYAVVLFAVAAVKEHFGNRGLFVVAGISGLTDVDAITLSTSRLVNEGRLSAQSGWKVILVASMSNLLFKGGMIALLGHRRLLAKVAISYGLALTAGVALLIFWPG